MYARLNMNIGKRIMHKIIDRQMDRQTNEYTNIKANTHFMGFYVNVCVYTICTVYVCVHACNMLQYCHTRLLIFAIHYSSYLMLMSEDVSF